MDMTTLFAERDSARRMRLEAALKRDHLAGRRQTKQLVEEELYETLVEDQRESLRPAQHVEHKLVSMLQAAPVFISQLQKDARPRPN